MKIAARRRLALGVLGTTSAMLAGVLIVPAIAAQGGLKITPAGAFNTQEAAELTFETTEADMNYGAEATFSRLGGGMPFTVSIGGNTVPSPSRDTEQTQEVDFTDMGEGLGNDGPADAGVYNVSLTGDPNPTGAPVPTAGGGNDTCTSCFTVLSPGPITVTSVAPTSLRPGQAGNVSILGNNFERGTKIDVLFPGGSVDTGVSANNPPLDEDGEPVVDEITTRTELKRRFVVAANSQSGVRDVRVTNLDGSTAVCSACFFVAGAELTSTNPTAGVNDPNGQLISITFSGPEVADGTPRLEFVGNPGAVPRGELTIVGDRTNYTGTSITGTFDLRNAAPGQYQPVVEAPGGVVNACQPSCRFTVFHRTVSGQERTPTLTSLDRSNLVGAQKNLRQGETATFAANGTNFAEGTTLVFDPPEGLTVTDVDFVSTERLSVTIAAAEDAPTGDKDVQARLTNGTTSAPCEACLTVTSGTGGSSPSPTATASPQPGNEEFAFDRFAGADRYATAARIATGSFTTASNVLIANGQSDDPRTSRNESHFPDALAGAYLAGFRQAPTLLVTETAVPQPTKDALRSLQAQNVTIIGGTSAVSTKVEEELEAAGYTVTRVAGPSRYDTAAAVASVPPSDYVGQNPDGDPTAVVASGERFPDALVAGPLGYNSKFPVLITAQASLSEPTRRTLQNLGIKHVLIPGGTTAVSQKTQDEIEALGITTQRFAGASRNETATLVAAYAYDTLGFDRAHVDLARGDQFPDALAGGPHAGTQQSPILLTATPNNIGAATESFLRQRGSALEEGDIFGGFSAVSQSAEDQAERAIREGTTSSEPEPTGSPTPTGSASPTATATATAAPTGSASPTATATPTGSPAPTGSPTPTSTVSPTSTPAGEETCPTDPFCP